MLDVWRHLHQKEMERRAAYASDVRENDKEIGQSWEITTPKRLAPPESCSSSLAHYSLTHLFVGAPGLSEIPNVASTVI